MTTADKIDLAKALMQYLASRNPNNHCSDAEFDSYAIAAKLLNQILKEIK